MRRLRRLACSHSLRLQRTHASGVAGEWQAFGPPPLLPIPLRIWAARAVCDRSILVILRGLSSTTTSLTYFIIFCNALLLLMLQCATVVTDHTRVIRIWEGPKEMKTILFMGGDTHEISLVPVEIDNSGFAQKLAASGITRFRRDGESKKLRGGVERSVLSSPLFTKENEKMELGGAYGFVRELSDDEVAQLEKASDEFEAQGKAKSAALKPSLIAQGRACYSCGRERKVTNGECVYCGADLEASK